MAKTDRSTSEVEAVAALAQAWRVVGRPTPGGIARLLAWARSGRTDVRVVALWALGQIPRLPVGTADDVLGALLELSRDDVPRVRAEAIEAVGQRVVLEGAGAGARRRVVRAVLAALDDEAPEVLLWAALAAGKLRLAAARGRLAELAATRSRVVGWGTVGRAAREALAMLDGRRVVRPVRPDLPAR